MLAFIRRIFGQKDEDKNGYVVPDKSAVRVIQSNVIAAGTDGFTDCVTENVRIDVNDNTVKYFESKGKTLPAKYVQSMIKPGWTVNRVFVSGTTVSSALPWPSLNGAKDAAYPGVKGLLWSPAMSKLLGDEASSVVNHRTPLYGEKTPNDGLTVFPLNGRGILKQSMTFFPHEVWPADRAVFDVPKQQMDQIIKYNYGVVVNGWYEDRERMKALGAYTHGSAILREGTENLYPAYDLHFKPVPVDHVPGKDARMPAITKMLNRIRYYPDSSVFVDALRQTGKRYALIVGGTIRKADLDAAKKLGESGAALGAEMARRWKDMKAVGFGGILTRSVSGACDTVSFEEEFCRGFFEEYAGSDRPVHHVKDEHLVYTRGDASSIVYGGSDVLSCSKSDWDAAERDGALASVLGGGWCSWEG